MSGKMRKTAQRRIRELRDIAVQGRVALLLVAAWMFAAPFLLGTFCLVYATTGVPCPGCGGTRALLALLRGDLHASLHYHALLVPATLALAVYFAVWLTHEKVPKAAAVVMVALVAVMVAYYGVRMIAMFPRESPMTVNGKAILPRIWKIIAGA
ncbi:MAG: DUF2752 domain-containing protein [Lachnospiraceae bacterium]|jgi:hypothetical protein|nr:DUF2752 domain-containing protein [Lachnospiraceae bacterium]